MARVVVDREKCEGLGMCEAMAHEFFEVGAGGTVTVLEENPTGEDVLDVKAAVESCPVSALSLVG